MHAADRYAFTLVDIRPTPNPGDHESHTADLSDLETVRTLCEGIDTVVHMAADPRTYAEFYADLLDANFKATYNIFRAAKDAGCRRVIFASSVNAVFGYPGSRQVRTTDAPMPGNVYGASKAFGESLGAYFGLVEGLSTLCIRIGGVGELTNIVGDTPVDIRSILVTMRDLGAVKVNRSVVLGWIDLRHLVDRSVTIQLPALYWPSVAFIVPILGVFGPGLCEILRPRGG
jgi:NAD+ dependent glucose-6-phosphate dehydrogenase